MGENSGIQWTHHTFNPWTRCTKVSPACDNCYAETWAKRAKRPQDSAGALLPVWGPDAPREMTSAHNWKQPLRWNREAIDAGERRRVFCASLADVFEDHPALADGHARECLWRLIDQCRGLDWLLLTKRPENVVRMVPREWLLNEWPANVWIGCTAESREMFAWRLPYLRAIPAPVRFLSIEPQIEDLGAVDLTGISWLIQGGESGPKARPFDLAWARSMRDTCRAAGVAYFLKQLGAAPFDTGECAKRHKGGPCDYSNLSLQLHLRDSHGGDESEWPADLRGCRAFPEVGR